MLQSLHLKPSFTKRKLKNLEGDKVKMNTTAEESSIPKWLRFGDHSLAVKAQEYVEKNADVKRPAMPTTCYLVQLFFILVPVTWLFTKSLNAKNQDSQVPTFYPVSILFIFLVLWRLWRFYQGDYESTTWTEEVFWALYMVTGIVLSTRFYNIIRYQSDVRSAALWTVYLLGFTLAPIFGVMYAVFWLFQRPDNALPGKDKLEAFFDWTFASTLLMPRVMWFIVGFLVSMFVWDFQFMLGVLVSCLVFAMVVVVVVVVGNFIYTKVIYPWLYPGDETSSLVEFFVALWKGFHKKTCYPIQLGTTKPAEEESNEDNQAPDTELDAVFEEMEQEGLFSDDEPLDSREEDDPYGHAKFDYE